MSIRLKDGIPLLIGGLPALAEDCCCDPGCLPNICVSPSLLNCKYCWDSACNSGQCLRWQSFEVAIDGVGEVSAIPWFVPDTAYCRDGWNCQCDLFNASFIHDLSPIVNNCEMSWLVRGDPGYTGIADLLCKSSSYLDCGFWRIGRQVSIRLAVANEQINYTSGVKSSITFPNYTTITSPGTNGLVCCNDYTLLPGHYVVVTLFVWGYMGAIANFPVTIFSDTKYFVYSFGNGIKFDESCGDDQFYPGCGPYIGGNATLFASSRYRRFPGVGTPFGPKVYTADCGSYDELCDLTTAVVTVEPPIIEVCPPPLPPL